MNDDLVTTPLSSVLSGFGFAIETLPRSAYLLLENIAAHVPDELAVHAQTVERWLSSPAGGGEVPFWPSRILMQDTAGVAAIADLAALRDRATELGIPAERVTPKLPIDLVIDHSVEVIESGHPLALARNMEAEFARNSDRYRFFKWAEQAFDTLTITPPGEGICHQINLERLSAIARQRPDGTWMGESVIGTDSHTTMINALGILGWGVGGMEAEIAALGQPLAVALPCVTELHLTGQRPTGLMATDIALEVTARLREAGVVGHFVEVTGDALSSLSLEDRAAIANMAPEYGATCALFPVDERTLDYFLRMGRSVHEIAAYRRYAKATGLWRDGRPRHHVQRISIDLSSIMPLMAGPARPQDRVPLAELPSSLSRAFPDVDLGGEDGSLAIAAITSCTNTANPHLMIAAGLVCRKARSLGLQVPPHVKTSLAPGSRRMANLLKRAGLQEDLDALGFHVAGLGCTTCVGLSGDLTASGQHLSERGVLLLSVLSGNRNFESRIHGRVRGNYLASPPLVVISALQGHLRKDPRQDYVTRTPEGRAVGFSELWPRDEEIEEALQTALNVPELREEDTGQHWTGLAAQQGTRFQWDPDCQFIRRPPFFERDRGNRLANIHDARPIAVLGDSVTTDHISPIGRIDPASEAALYLTTKGCNAPFGAYGERRANHEVMWRGTFAHPRLVNRLAGRTGPFTRIEGHEDDLPIFAAAQRLTAKGRDVVIFAGKEYGTGSARDWAAKGTAMLGVRAVIAQSFERIHRSNLAGAGVLPVLIDEEPASLGLTPETRIELLGLSEIGIGRTPLRLCLTTGGATRQITVHASLASQTEIDWLRAGDVFSYALSQLRL